MRVFLALLLSSLLTVGCQPRQRGYGQAPRWSPPPSAPAAARVPVPPAPPPRAEPPPPPPIAAPRVLPTISGEPQVTVAVGKGISVLVALLQAGTTTNGTRIPVGTYTARMTGAGPRLGTVQLPANTSRIRFARPGPTFRIGKRTHTGSLGFRRDAAHVVAVEGIGMEAYLTGVLAKEVEPDWPLESLKAQAVAARSYATSQWLARYQRPWHLDASEQVDMAYAGHVARPHPRLATALSQTRGNLLWFNDQPLVAYFHAASGGHTELMTAVWPKRTMPDGRTSPSPAMPPRDDPWDRAGRAVAPQRLGAWKAVIPVTKVRTNLIASGFKQVGPISGISIVEMARSKARCRRLRVRWTGGHLDLSGHQFRMANGSTTVKSTRWRDFRIQGSDLVIQGHGYGHGVGLPQASAWAMAKAGKAASEILMFFYSGARIVDKW